MRVACHNRQLQAVEGAQPDVGDEAVERRGPERSPRIFETPVRNDILAGVTQRPLQRLQQRWIVVYNQDFLSGLAVAHLSSRFVIILGVRLHLIPSLS